MGTCPLTAPPVRAGKVWGPLEGGPQAEEGVAQVKKLALYGAQARTLALGSGDSAPSSLAEHPLTAPPVRGKVWGHLEGGPQAEEGEEKC